jgi:hypothetical protein
MLITRIILINCGVLFALIFATELIFGSWLYGPEYGTLNLPRNAVHHYDTSNLYAEGGAVRYTRDKNGLRGPYDDISNIDILTIGGSTTNQLYIDDTKTWQENMRMRFAQVGRPLSIVNAGVDGQSTRGHIAIFERWFPNIPNLKAKYILAYVGINDTVVEGAMKFDQMQSPERLRRWRHWIMNKSALYGLYRTVRGIYKAYNAKLIHGGSPPYNGRKWVRFASENPAIDPTGPLAKRLNDYETRLRALVGKIRGFGAKAILVTQPIAALRVRDAKLMVSLNTAGQLEPGISEIVTAFNQKTMLVCRELRAVCLDLAHQLGFEDGDFYDRIHSTNSGAEKIGGYLYEQLRSRI